MWSCRALTSWDQTAAGNAPVLPPLPAGCGWEDVTGQQEMLPEPNLVVLRIRATDAYLAALEAAPSIEVLEAEEVPDAKAS